MKKFLAWISSMKLAIGLIAYLAIASGLATLVPQGLTDDAYRGMYPRLLAELVVQARFGAFFTSILFIIPAFAFFANLSACTVKRLARELGKKKGRRHGPDVLHVGLVLLVLGGVWSFSGHKQGSVILAPGEGANLPDGSTLKLVDFRYDRYPDGRPKDWVSVVTIEKDGKALIEERQLRVNEPLRHAGLTFYQSTYQEAPALALVDASGHEMTLAQGEERFVGDTAYYFMAPESGAGGATAGSAAMGSAAMGSAPAAESGKAVVRVGSGAEAKTVRVGPGEQVGELRVVGLKPMFASGIEAVSDPGYPLVFAALLLIALGTAITFFQKIREGV